MLEDSYCLLLTFELCGGLGWCGQGSEGGQAEDGEEGGGELHGGGLGGCWVELGWVGLGCCCWSGLMDVPVHSFQAGTCRALLIPFSSQAILHVPT